MFGFITGLLRNLWAAFFLAGFWGKLCIEDTEDAWCKPKHFLWMICTDTTCI